MSGELLLRVPIQLNLDGIQLNLDGIQYVEIRRNPFGDSHTVELVLPEACKNRVILPLTLFDRKEIRWRQPDAA